MDGERKAVEADLGPVRYLATLIGSTDEQTMRCDSSWWSRPDAIAVARGSSEPRGFVGGDSGLF